MKTVKITDKYYVRIAGKNYIACELIKRKEKDSDTEYDVFVKPTYHVDFESALQNIDKRLIKENLESPDVYTLRDAIRILQGRKSVQNSEYYLNNSKDEVVDKTVDVENIELIEDDSETLE